MRRVLHCIIRVRNPQHRQHVCRFQETSRRFAGAPRDEILTELLEAFYQETQNFSHP
jgi:hypothetical protein